MFPLLTSAGRMITTISVMDRYVFVITQIRKLMGWELNVLVTCSGEL